DGIASVAVGGGEDELSGAALGQLAGAVDGNIDLEAVVGGIGTGDEFLPVVIDGAATAIDQAGAAATLEQGAGVAVHGEGTGEIEIDPAGAEIDAGHADCALVGDRGSQLGVAAAGHDVQSVGVK